VEDNDVHRFTPLFALDDQGVKLLAVPYASRIEPTESMSEAVKSKNESKNESKAAKTLPGDESTGEPAASTLGLRPSLSTLDLRPSIM
jgi:hypothetical protein